MTEVTTNADDEILEEIDRNNLDAVKHKEWRKKNKIKKNRWYWSTCCQWYLQSYGLDSNEGCEELNSCNIAVSLGSFIMDNMQILSCVTKLFYKVRASFKHFQDSHWLLKGGVQISLVSEPRLGIIAISQNASLLPSYQA